MPFSILHPAPRAFQGQFHDSTSHVKCGEIPALDTSARHKLFAEICLCFAGLFGLGAPRLQGSSGRPGSLPLCLFFSSVASSISLQLALSFSIPVSTSIAFPAPSLDLSCDDVAYLTSLNGGGRPCQICTVLARAWNTACQLHSAEALVLSPFSLSLSLSLSCSHSFWLSCC